MGNGASSWLAGNPGGFMVSLLGNDHVKFGCGAAARCARTLPTLARHTNPHPLSHPSPSPLHTHLPPNPGPSPHLDPHQVRAHARRRQTRAHSAHQPTLGRHHPQHRPSPPRASVDGAAAPLHREQRGGGQRGMDRAEHPPSLAAAYRCGRPPRERPARLLGAALRYS